QFGGERGWGRMIGVTCLYAPPFCLWDAWMDFQSVLLTPRHAIWRRARLGAYDRRYLPLRAAILPMGRLDGFP
ncbi:hypothetical protein V5H41_29110, partial [Salmonella enterica]